MSDLTRHQTYKNSHNRKFIYFIIQFHINSMLIEFFSHITRCLSTIEREVTLEEASICSKMLIPSIISAVHRYHIYILIEYISIINFQRPDGASSTNMMGMGNNVEASSGTQVLYGTNINSNEVQTKLRNFIQTFVQIDENDERYDMAPFYMTALEQIKETEQYILDINCDHVYEFDQGLYR